jgi:hypothetical protein
MANLEDRKKAFESKYAHDAAMVFKAEARRNRKLALWVGEKMGMSDEEAKAYGSTLIAADMQEAGDDDVIKKIVADAKEKSVTLDEAELKAKSAELLTESKAEIMAEE